MATPQFDQQIQDAADASEALYREMMELHDTADKAIRALHGAKQIGQIQLLWMACSLAIKDIDRAMWERMLREAKQ